MNSRLVLPPPTAGSRAARRRTATLSGSCVAVALALTACGGASAGSSASSAEPAAASGEVGELLTIAYPSGPGNLDPTKIFASNQYYVNLAYDPLIYKAPDGTLEPRLATEWDYVGTGNTIFELTLREGVEFSDGTALTAEVVKANLERQAKEGVQAAPYLASKTFEVTGPLSLRITSATPDPLIPELLTQDYLAGNIASGEALEDPASLSTTTAGAGPYVLDAAGTTSGSTYTYVQNPNYWNPDDVHYEKVVIKVIANPQAALNAVKTGQADVTTADARIAKAAEAAGLQTAPAPFVFQGLALLDREGTVSEPLGDVRVRQAMNYAVDREKITAGLYGKYGTATEQTVVPGQDGSLDEPVYSYDVDKAKALLAEAGYEDGFDLPVVTTTGFGLAQTTQAVAADLAKVGIRLEVTTQNDVNAYVTDLTSGKFPAAGVGLGGQPMHLAGPTIFLPGAAIFNPFKSDDAEIVAKYAEAAAAAPEDRAQLDREIEQRLVEQAWFLPVVLTPVVYIANDEVAGVAPTAEQPLSNPVSWAPAK